MNAPAPAPVCTLILAGRRPGVAAEPVAQAGGRSVKALVPVHGRPMIERVVSALRASPAVGALHLSLPDDVPVATECPALARWLAEGTVRRVAPQPSPSASVLDFVAPRATAGTVLVTTGDHPLLTTAMVDEFLAGFAAAGAEAAVAVTRTEELLRRYPGSHRTKLEFRDGRYSGCNLFAFRGAGAIGVLRFWRGLDQHRKQPWRIAWAIGLWTLWLYRRRALDLAGILDRLGRRAGTRLAAITLTDPHAGIDVDSPADLALVHAILRAREPDPAPPA